MQAVKEYDVAVVVAVWWKTWREQRAEGTTDTVLKQEQEQIILKEAALANSTSRYDLENSQLKIPGIWT